MRYVDALGRTLEVRSAPQRIVSLVPSLTEALFVFGVGARVVGVSDFCVEPREAVSAKTKVGGTKTVDVAQVQALQPDLVVASAEENRREDIQSLVRAGLDVFVTLPTTVGGAIDLLEQLAGMTGAVKAGARVVAEAREALAEVQASNEERQPVRTFCPIWRNPWMTVGPGSYMHDFITVCGGDNVFGLRHERYPRVQLSEMAERDPEVVLLPDEPYPFDLKHVPEISAFREVSAVRDGRIHLLEGKHLCWYGPRIAGSLRYVSGLIRQGGA
jgi:ABC-type Fe3+-hydroxamate transport system substrate-binding protein